MISKTQRLEHLDGKPVRYSTITSQFPEVFANRKRNTGEIIVTTDTDPEYGMHHIYAGGEHIACGYGFATPETRDDLVYIQETYIGTFNYFNDAYTYFNKAYEWTRSYMFDAYAYCLDYTYNNSYLRTTVDKNNNEIKFSDDYSYILEFDNKIGQISLSYNVYPKAEISVDNNMDEVLLNSLKEDYDNRSNIKFTVNIKCTQNVKRYEELNKDSITHIYLNDKEQQYITINTNTENNETFMSFDIYITKNVDSNLYIEYVIKGNDGQEINKTSNVLNFVWVYPIYTICVNDISNINKDVINNNDCRRLVNYKNLNNLYNNITIKDNYSINTPNRIYMLLPNTLSPKFYISFDNSKRGDLEGVMCLSSYIYNNDELNDDLKNLKSHYNYYCSSYYYIEKNIRVDVTW